MKKMRKLLPAIAMLLVSAVMMSTASFAWFTMNSEVTATGMQVTAVAPASLWISQDTTESWGSTIVLADANMATRLVPSITSVLGTDGAISGTGRETWNAWSFVTLDSDSAQDVPNSGATPTGAKYVAAKDTVANKNYFFQDAIKLLIDGQAGFVAPITVQVALASTVAEGETDAIWRALRVAVVVDGSALVFEFDDDSKENADDEGKINYSGAFTTYTDAQTLRDDFATGTPIDAVVYAWFEGIDEDCINAHAYGCDNFLINLKFNLGDVEAPTPGSGT